MIIIDCESFRPFFEGVGFAGLIILPVLGLIFIADYIVVKLRQRKRRRQHREMMRERMLERKQCKRST